MKLSTATLLTLATVVAQDNPGEAQAVVIDDLPDLSLTSVQADDTQPIMATVSPPTVSPPELILSQGFTSDGFTSDYSISDNTNSEPIAQLDAVATAEDQLNLTVILLNCLLLVATLCPILTMTFFWLIRRSVVRELVQEVGHQLNQVEDLEKHLRTSHQRSKRLVKELELKIGAAQKSIEFLNREAAASKVAMTEIKSLQEQFIQQIQTILQDVHLSKEKALQKIEIVVNSGVESAQDQPEANPDIENGNPPRRKGALDSSLDSSALSLQQFAGQQETSQAPQSPNADLSDPTPTKTTVTNSSDSEAQSPSVNPPQFPSEQALDLSGEDFSQALGNGFSVHSQPAFIADDYLKQGEALMNEKRYSQAISTFQKALKLNPKFDLAWYCQGNAFVRSKAFPEALKAYNNVLKLQPNKSEAWYNRGNVLVRLKRYGEALESYNRALKIQPNDDEAWHNRGVLLRRFKRYAEAVESYDRALAIQPNKYETWHNRGNALGKLQQNEEAVASYDRAIA
ncbi:MAG: tetratricopeptide repeat protein [Oscillatoriales cyanobacterium RM2_1_1]|nr:tetratricopeptide repeat protein [Oscillatoriales cyanobacterium RM2_1_1]